MNQTELILPVDALRHDAGYCWTIELPAEIAVGDDIDNPAKSDLQLWEGERPLGPPHADHNRIRNVGRGLYSHWGRRLYFSSATTDEPTTSGMTYRILASKAGDDAETTRPSPNPSQGTFPRLAALAKELRRANTYGSTDLLYNPAGDPERRIKMLEAKVEYLLDRALCREISASSACTRIAPI